MKAMQDRGTDEHGSHTAHDDNDAMFDHDTPFRVVGPMANLAPVPILKSGNFGNDVRLTRRNELSRFNPTINPLARRRFPWLLAYDVANGI